MRDIFFPKMIKWVIFSATSGWLRLEVYLPPISYQYIVICDHYPYIAILYQYFSTINHNYSPLTTSCNNYHVTVMHLVF